MQANPRTITALFEPTLRYVVPMFQRHYVWSREEQWEPLWNDINEKLTARQLRKRPSPHFLGAVILAEARRTSTKQVSRFVVIDGQQRLATFQLLLSALRDSAQTCNLPHVGRAAERCLLNPDVELMEKPDEEQYKLWPTLVNRSAFCGIVSARSHEKVRALFPIVRLPRKRKPEPREKLAEAYEFFFDRIADLCSACKPADAANDVLIDLLGVLRDDFTVVEIILGEHDDSQEIFNSLNARGKPLNQSDLLRSYIFMRAEKADVDRDRLYDAYWSRFEGSWWDQETRRGNQTSSRLDILTRTILSSKLGAPVDVRRVHAAYTDWIETNSPYQTLEEELRDFVNYGAYFEQLNDKSEGPLSVFGRRMYTWETTTVFPLAIFLAAEGALSSEDLLECLAHIEGFVVRRAVCGLQTKEYNKFFVEMISRLRTDGVSCRAVRELLSAGEGETRRFPSDEEFAFAWKAKPVYSRLTSGQLIVMFQQLEGRVRSDRAEATSIPHVSIEHIMPQQWTDNYRLADEQIPKDMNTDWFWGTEEEEERYKRLRPLIQQRRVLIQSIGNLTAVTQPLNAAMRNAGFVEKKQYFRESVLALNRYFDGVSDWNEQAIQDRADRLFNYARAIWQGP